jgi:ABC-type uncharacterized transport system auxiliary subunit
MKRVRKISQEQSAGGGFSMGAKGVFLVVALAAASACGCGSVPATRYYQLTMGPDAAAGARGDQLPVTLLVGPIGGSHLYRDDRLIYGTGTEELGAYEYERWVEPPTEMVQDLLLRELRTSGRYRGVYPMGSTAHGDYVLRGDLYDLKEVSGNPVAARVTLELRLRDTKGGADVWTQSYTHDEPVNGKDAAAVVAALDRNLQQGTKDALASLDQYLASHPPK